MIGKNKERWLELCERAVVEQDSTKLLQLAREINDLLEQKQRHLAEIEKPKDERQNSN